MADDLHSLFLRTTYGTIGGEFRTIPTPERSTFEVRVDRGNVTLTLVVIG